MCPDSNSGGIEEEEERVALIIEYYSPISFFDYLDKIKGDRTITETSPERLLRIINKAGKEEKSDANLVDYKFFRQPPLKVEGLREVLENLVRGIETASRLLRKNRILPILILGPTGSGKTLIQKIIDGKLKGDWEENPRYTFRFRSPVPGYCPCNEEPIHLLTTSLLPSRIRKRYKYGNGELCPVCYKRYEKTLREWSRGKEGSLLQLLNESVEVIPFRPTAGVVALSHEKFAEAFEAAAMQCNRGVLHIEIDDKKISEMPSINYQLLLKLRDKSLPLKDGTVLSPDLTVFLYGGREVIKGLESNTPLVDSVYPVPVRRNLSYTAEKRIYQQQDLPFHHISPHALELLAKYAVGTRVYRVYEKELRRAVKVYEKYESLKILSEEEIEIIRSKLLKKTPEDGWERGLSSRQLISKILVTAVERGCLTLEIVDKFLEKEANTNWKKIVKDELDKIAFGDLMLAYTAVIMGNGGNIASVETTFTRYLDLLREKKLKRKTKITILGEGDIPIQDAIDEILARLNVTDLDDIVSKCYEESGDAPTFVEVVIRSPELITKNKNLKTYIPWKEYQRGVELSPHHKERVDKLLAVLTEIGYCEECGKSLIKMGSKKIGD